MYRERALANSEFSRHMKPQKAQAQHWSTVSIGSSIYHLDLSILVRDRKVGVSFYCSGDKELAKVVIVDKDRLGEIIGVKAEPFGLEETKKDSGLHFYLEGCDIEHDRDRWPEFIDWQLHSAVKLRKEVLRLVG